VVAPDLLDRAIQLELPTIPRHRRRPERRRHPDEPPGVLDGFDDKRPHLLGALLDAVVGTLREASQVRLKEMPRMADFAIGAAAEKAATAEPWEEERSSFLLAYAASNEEAQEHAIEGSLIGPTLLDWLNGLNWQTTPTAGTWSGTYDELADILISRAGEAASRRPGWPRTAGGLCGEIRRLAPALRGRRYEVITGSRGPSTRRAILTLRRLEDDRPVEALESPFESFESSETQQPEEVTTSVESFGTPFAEQSQSFDDPSAPPSKDSKQPPKDAPKGSMPAVTAEEQSEMKGSKGSNDLPDPRTVAVGDVLDGLDEREAIQTEAELSDADLSWPEEAADVTQVTVSPTFEPPDVEYIIQTSRLEAILPDLLQVPVLGLDTETTGRDPLKAALRTIQLATHKKTVIIDAARCPVQALAPLFTTERRFLRHNLKFDLKFLVAAGLPWPQGHVVDTMLAAQLLDAGTPEGALKQCGLAAVVGRYL
jgi:3'-5' exonuclease